MPEGARGGSRATGMPWWIYASVGFFLVLALWIYVLNTRAIRAMAITKERLRSRVQAVCGVLQAAQARRRGAPAGSSGANTVQLSEIMDGLEETERARAEESEYLFILDKEGRMWLNGGQPQLCRSATREGGEESRPGPRLTGGALQDSDDIVQKLLQRAQQGGGFVSYMWRHPGTQETKPKTSYVQEAPASGLVVGCGTYA